MFIVLEMHSEQIVNPENSFNYLAVGNYHKKIRGFFPAFDTYKEAVEAFPNSTIHEIKTTTSEHGIKFADLEK